MLKILFYTVLFSDIILLLGVAFSVGIPRYRIWPPPSKNSWQYWVSWIFITISSVGVPVIGLLDWESLGPIHWIRFAVGGLLMLGFVLLIYWGVRTLSLHQSLGLEGKLITTGPYKYTRNPQYLALILFYVSVILVTSSYLAFLTGSLLIMMYAITPLSEEPWLEDLFGVEYLDYRKRVPRFVGLRKAKKEMSQIEENR
ncbi:MAG: methyltransferase family protein [Candidatus Thorarchaeota archaeon]|jgi:protein-S-isoprenylcysteine O-methyltransferase Ste14